MDVHATKLAPTRALALGFGAAKNLIEVKDIAHASATYRAAVVASGRGYSTTPQGWVYDLSGAVPKRIAKVSYNGCVWALGKWTPETTPLFDPHATARVAS